MDWLSVAIEEYKTLREESLSSMKMQQSILSFGTATIGIILSVPLVIFINMLEISVMAYVIKLFINIKNKLTISDMSVMRRIEE